MDRKIDSFIPHTIPAQNTLAPVNVETAPSVSKLYLYTHAKTRTRIESKRVLKSQSINHEQQQRTTTRILGESDYGRQQSDVVSSEARDDVEDDDDDDKERFRDD